MTLTRAASACCLVVVTLLSGCGMDPVRDRYESRTTYSSCGEVLLGQGDEVTQSMAAEIRCLRRAIQVRKGAELSVAYPTTDGDLIRNHYRLEPDGRLELYSDSTDHEYSDDEWEYFTCVSPEWLPEVECVRTDAVAQ